MPKVAMAEKPEFGLWSGEKIELKKTHNGFVGEMEVTAQNQMGGKVTYTRALSILAEPSRSNAPLDFRLDIKNKHGDLVDDVVFKREFYTGLTIRAELTKGGRMDTIYNALPAREATQLQAELTRLFENKRFKEHIEKVLEEAKREKLAMPDKEEFQRHIWKKD